MHNLSRPSSDSNTFFKVKNLKKFQLIAPSYKPPLEQQII